MQAGMAQLAYLSWPTRGSRCAEVADRVPALRLGRPKGRLALRGARCGPWDDRSAPGHVGVVLAIPEDSNRLCSLERGA